MAHGRPARRPLNQKYAPSELISAYGYKEMAEEEGTDEFLKEIDELLGDKTNGEKEDKETKTNGAVAEIPKTT